MSFSEETIAGSKQSKVTTLMLVVSQIRWLILSRQVKPGERLVQEEIAARLKVSRTPVREALHQLAKEGLVAISPYRGASVAALDPAALEEIYHVRIALESYAARLVARQIDEKTLDALRFIYEQMQRAYANGDAEGLLEVNRNFYVHMYRATRQERLYSMIINHLDLSRQYRRLYFHIAHLAARTIDEHQQIIAALAARDEDGAETLIRTGLEATAKGLLEALVESESKVMSDE